MRLPPLLEPARAAFQGTQFKPTVILVVSSLAIVAWRYCGSPQFYLDHLSSRWGPSGAPEFLAAAYSYAFALVILGLLPAAIVRWSFRERLADYGVRWGDRRRLVRSFLIFAPMVALIAYLASRDPAYQAFYPIDKNACASSSRFAAHAGLYLLYYLGYEFHFRGFLQMGLRESMGDVNALLVQILASVLFHIGKPGSEVFGAFFAGLLWGILAYRTRSLLSGTLQHALLGILLDWFVCRA